MPDCYICSLKILFSNYCTIDFYAESVSFIFVFMTWTKEQRGFLDLQMMKKCVLRGDTYQKREMELKKSQTDSRNGRFKKISIMVKCKILHVKCHR